MDTEFGPPLAKWESEMLTFDKQIEIAKIANATGEVIAGGNFALCKSGFIPPSDSKELTLYFMKPTIDSAVGAARERIKRANPGGRVDVLIIHTSDLEYPPEECIEIGPRGSVLSREDSLRNQIQSFARVGRTPTAADYWQIHQIDSRLGPYGFDGFIAARLGTIQVEQLRRYLRMTWSNPSINRTIREYEKRMHVDAGTMLSSLASLERRRLPITSATVQLSQAIKNKDNEAGRKAKLALARAVETMRGGFTSPPLRLPSGHWRSSNTAESLAAAEACEKISRFQDGEVVPGFNVELVPDYYTGRISTNSQISLAARHGQNGASTSSASGTTPTKFTYSSQSDSRGPAL
ncbi:hypothetical protein ACFWD7_58130 [Streptomyces mirabilis]|uniref:hypothetical protein n=1 Tax=Streptomyces mirabilis TaxID=68239 RepID=UPI00369CEB60